MVNNGNIPRVRGQAVAQHVDNALLITTCSGKAMLRDGHQIYNCWYNNRFSYTNVRFGSKYKLKFILLNFFCKKSSLGKICVGTRTVNR